MKEDMKGLIENVKGRIKDGFWWLVSGAVLAMVIGFTFGGWSTASATQKISDHAVLASQSSICVAQFMKDPASKEKLKDFAGLDSWKRSEYVEKGGWDKMPGQETAGYEVSRECAIGIEALIKK